MMDWIMALKHILYLHCTHIWNWKRFYVELVGSFCILTMPVPNKNKKYIKNLYLSFLNTLSLWYVRTQRWHWGVSSESLFSLQGKEDCVLLILEKLSDTALINATNAALQTWVFKTSVHDEKNCSIRCTRNDPCGENMIVCFILDNILSIQNMWF